MNIRKAEHLHIKHHPENGSKSLLVGIQLGKHIIYYPKYRDILQILQTFFLKEDYRYPKPDFQGRDKLLQAIIEVYEGTDIDIVCETHKLEDQKLPYTWYKEEEKIRAV